MFTGIVKEIGKIEKYQKDANLTKIAISSSDVYSDAQVSDSIAVNGVCLTVVNKDKKLLYFDAVGPTLDKTNLKKLKQKDLVNLEPALAVGDKLGGHFVLGHIDGEVKLTRSIRRGNFWQVEVELPSRFRKFVIENGSVAIDGVSLTVKKVLPRSFTLDIIPFTFEHTTLKYKKPGSCLNVEFDYLLKSKVNK